MTPFKLNPPPLELMPGSTILAYLRDSGHETQELSIAQQQRALEEWANLHSLVITRFFVDEARRGSSVAGREQLQQLMFALRHGAPEKGVVVWSYSRFSRGLDEPTLYRSEIRTLGYTFHSLTDDVPDGPIGRIVEAVIDYKNYQYLVDLSIDIQRGQRDLVMTHGCIPGTPPRGFKRVAVTLGKRRDGTPHIAHRWSPDPDTAPLVLKAFQMRAEGATLSTIRAETRLYSSINSFVTMWSNKLYIGIMEFGDLVIDNYCQPVVPLDLWQLVQDKQQTFKTHSHMTSELDHPRRVASRYLLSGLLRCTQCDGVVNGNTSTFRGQRATDTYQCANVRKHACSSRRIPKQLLEETIIKSVKDYILDPDVALERQKLDMENYQGKQAETDKQRVLLRKRLVKCRRALNNISSVLKERKHSPTLLAQLDELESEQTSLLSQIAQLERPAPVVNLDRSALARRAEAIINLFDSGSLEEQHAVLHGIIQRIKVENKDKRIRGVVYYYSPSHDPPAVSIALTPPGAPRFIHSITFDVWYKTGTPRKKKKDQP